MQSFNYDISSLQKVNPTNGIRRYKITLAKEGVYPYFRDGKITYEYKSKSELSRPELLESLKGLPLLDYTSNGKKDHIRDESGKGVLVNLDQIKKHEVGTILDVMPVTTADGVEIVGDVAIKDQSVIDYLESKKQSNETVQVSLGFKHELKQESGIYNNKKYDYLQTGIIGNHVNIVDHGRAGDSARIQVDGVENCGVMITNLNNKQERKMGQITYHAIDGTDRQVDESAAIVIADLKEIKKENQVLKSAAEKSSTDSLTAIEAMKQENESLKLKVKELENKKVSIDSSELDKLVSDREGVIATLKKVDGDFSVAGKSNIELQKQVVLKSGMAASVDSMDDLTVQQLYSAASILVAKQANLIGVDGADTGIDNEVAKLKAARLNMQEAK